MSQLPLELPTKNLYLAYPNEFRAWDNMIQRCKHPAYKEDYWGRGITVCERWANSFRDFLTDMGPKPVPYKDYSLDRINNDGNYEPGNCRWATWHQQATNKRTPKNPRPPRINKRYDTYGPIGNKRPVLKITYQDKTLSLWDWAKEIGSISPETIGSRLSRGWPVEKALFTPIANNSKGNGKYKRRTLTVDGVTHTLKQWSKITGIKYITILDRTYKGWSADEIISQPRTHEECGKIGAKNRWHPPSA